MGSVAFFLPWLEANDVSRRQFPLDKVTRAKFPGAKDSGSVPAGLRILGTQTLTTVPESAQLLRLPCVVDTTNFSTKICSSIHPK